MAQKIMLVEDDTNLSEIYKARLEAEGFQVISAKDGEEALAIAVKEHPDLIISDVMMPKISGFDMLDILRGTEGVKNTKVIMMTALGQSEDKARAEKLGADRYLVKSQVTLEDVVKTVHDVLGGEAAAPSTPTTAAVPAEEPAAIPPASNTTDKPPITQISITQPPAEPSTESTPATAEDTQPASSPAVETNLTQTSSAEKSEVLSQIQDFVDKQETAAKSTNNGELPSEHSTKIIQPLSKVEPVDTTPTEPITTSTPETPEQSTGVTAPPEPPTTSASIESTKDPNSIAL